MPADVIVIADALALEFQNRITLAGIIDTVVSREYEVTYDLGTFTGRKVDIFPLSYNPEELEATRSEEYYDFRYAFVIMERYVPMGVVPKDWVDGQVNFVEEQIFNPLDQRVITVIDNVEYWSTQTEVTSVFDYDMLRQKSVFWSEVETTFRKVATGL